MEQFVGKLTARELEVFELLCVHKAAGAIVLENQAVFVENLTTRDCLWLRESIADDFEDHVVAGHGEYNHDHAGNAARDLELIVRVFEMAEHVAVEFGLAVLVVADRDVEFRWLFLRNDRPQKLNELGGFVGEYPEVGMGEAEENTRGVLLEKDCVHTDARVRVFERNHEWKELPVTERPSDEIRGSPAVKDRARHFGTIDLRRKADRLEVLAYAGRYQGDIALHVFVLDAE